MTGNSQGERRNGGKKRERKGHQGRRHYDGQRGEWAAVGESFGCSEGKAGGSCWLVVAMEHLIVICLFSDG